MTLLGEICNLSVSCPAPSLRDDKPLRALMSRANIVLANRNEAYRLDVTTEERNVSEQSRQGDVEFVTMKSWLPVANSVMQYAHSASYSTS
ncbi:uncharacterized protein SPSK_10821 [Sporothrix schenckii 1099-18]|uniref:Uncharacterized protein n=1 Tax=Sporothrix schenckii 1099-18 TaxID=1397361 RepID=A0A0F2MI78_SPOSC|nr:uncharacterized protein SPSK_10821 [Sporothrix schenckii 1099-18]KJR88764.1 hypothetical protein SPSK_10821 [Sporothrix schenckii 1099-18]